MKKKLIITVVVVAVAAVAIKMSLGFFGNSVPTSVTPSVAFEEVKVDTVISEVKADGDVEFKDSSFVYAGSSAEIVSVNCEVGDEVEKGEILIEYNKDVLDDLKKQLSDAELDLRESSIELEKIKTPPNEYETEQAKIKIQQSESQIDEVKYRLEQLQTSINQAETNVKNAENDYKSNKILYDNGVISKDDFDKFDKNLTEVKNTLEGYKKQYEAEKLTVNTAEKNLESAKIDYNLIINRTELETSKKDVEAQEVRVSKAKLKIEQLKKDIADFRVNEIASESGTVISVKAKKGEIPSQGSGLIEIGDINELVVKAYIDEYDMKEINIGQAVKMEGDSFNGTIDGKIFKIYPIAEDKEKNGTVKKMVTVEISVDKDKLSFLKAGYTVDVEIITNINENAKIIPLTSLMTDKDGVDYVFIVNDQNIIEKRNITLINYADMYIEAEGLEVGEKVVTDTEIVAEGMLVSVGDDSSTEVSEISSDNSSVEFE